jgi:putative ATP-binding cassette transporter
VTAHCGAAGADVWTPGPNLPWYEQVGTARIYSVLDESATILSLSASSIAGAFSSSVMLIFATLHVAYLSLIAFIMLFAVSAVGIFLFSKTRENLEALLKRSIEKETEFFGLLRNLLHGIKEVKLNQARSEDLYHEVGRRPFKP